MKFGNCFETRKILWWISSSDLDCRRWHWLFRNWGVSQFDNVVVEDAITSIAIIDLLHHVDDPMEVMIFAERRRTDRYCSHCRAYMNSPNRSVRRPSSKKSQTGAGWRQEASMPEGVRTSNRLRLSGDGVTKRRYWQPDGQQETGVAWSRWLNVISMSAKPPFSPAYETKRKC